MSRVVIITILLLPILLLGCSETEQGEPIDQKTPDPMEEYYFVELGLKPSQKDKINEIVLFKKYDDCYLLGGQRNNQAWFSKLDKQGNEIYSWEAPKLETKKYSIIQQNMIAFENDKFLFLKIVYSNNNYPYLVDDKNYKVFLSIIDFQCGEDIDVIRPQNSVWNFVVRENNGRYLIEQNLDASIGYYHVAGKDGKILYEGEYDDIKSSTFFDGIIFIDDEIVVPQVNDRTKFFTSGYYFPIVNLKTWEMLCRIDENLGLVPQGDHLGEPDIDYEVDTIYLEDSYLKFEYSEIQEMVDEISKKEYEVVLNKYSYSIDTSTYEVVFDGKI